MQKINVKVTDIQTGAEVTKTLHVIRSWQDADGTHIHLLHNGVYAYKDGSPVKDARHLSIIGDRRQRAAAENWWRAHGKTLSADYYSAVDAALARRAGDYSPATMDASDKDSVLYFRQPQGGTIVEGPYSWMDLFPGRPDWWGQAREIDFPDYAYTRSDAMPEPEQATSADDDPVEVAPQPPAAGSVDYYVFKTESAKNPIKIFSGETAQADAIKWAAEKGYTRIEASAKEEAPQPAKPKEF